MQLLETDVIPTGTCLFSREEVLMWERKRLATWGIPNYELHEPSGSIIFPASSALYHCLDDTTKVRNTAHP